MPELFFLLEVIPPGPILPATIHSFKRRLILSQYMVLGLRSLGSCSFVALS